MRPPLILPLFAAFALVAQAPAPKPETRAEVKIGAEVKVGTGVENHEIQGESTSFKVAAGTKLFAWTKVTGAADSTVTMVFSRGELNSKQELKIPHSPYRTQAYRTFRLGDEGAWTVKVLAADGAELGTASFSVEME